VRQFEFNAEGVG